MDVQIVKGGPMREPPCSFYAVLHRPRFYRYRVAHAGFRLAPNSYGHALIGVALVIGSYAYCVKWADARSAL